MKIGKACAIFLKIDSDEYTLEEKGTAIYHVIKMPTHNGINKDAMLAVIRFLLNLAFDLPEQEAKICAGGCVRNYADPLAHCDGCSLNEERKKNDDRN